MPSMLAVPETISSSQARPRAIDLISAVRLSAFIGRARDFAVEAGSRISLNLLAGGFVQGINSVAFASIGAGGAVVSPVPSRPGRISQSAKRLLRTSMRATMARMLGWSAELACAAAVLLRAKYSLSALVTTASMSGPRRDVMGSLLGQSPLHGLKQLAVDQ